jgi:hypothetical protein
MAIALGSIRSLFASLVALSAGHALLAQGSPAWTPGPGEAEGPWTLAVPAVPPVEGVRLLATAPASFPRPVAVRGDVSVALPLEPDPALLRRVDAGEAPRLTWVAKADLADGGGGVLVAHLMPAGTAAARPWTPWDDGPIPPPEKRRLDVVRRTGWRTPLASVQAGRDPARKRGPDVAAVQELRTVPLRPVLAARPVTGTTRESVVATADRGGSWVELELQAPADAPEAVHLLRTGDVLGVVGARPPRLVVAPRPLGRRSVFELLEVDREGGVASLGVVAVREAPWSQRVTSVRQGEAGALEAVTLVHDLASAPEARTDSWGAVLRLQDDGAWSEVARFPLPEPDPRAIVRFAADRSDELVLTLDGFPPRRLALPALRVAGR